MTKLSYNCCWWLLVVAAGACAQPSSSRPTLAIVEKAAGKVSFYNADRQRIGEVKVGAFPHEAVLSPDARHLYVSDNGVLWMTEDAKGDNTISVIDVHAMKRVAAIDLGTFHRPHGIVFDVISGNLLATTERPYRLIMVNPTSRKVVRDYDVLGKSPHMVILAADGQRAWVSNTDSSSVAVIHLKTGATKLIPTGERPQGGVLDPSGTTLYLTNSGADRISIIDTASDKVIGAIETGKGPGRVAITPDGKTLVYNLQGDLGVGFASVLSGKELARLSLGGRPLSLTMTSDGKRAFAGVQDQDKVFEIDVPGRTVIRVLETPKGSGPDPAIPIERSSSK